LDAKLLDVPAAALSGGQRSRLAMAIVSFERPHVLIMDEPTNNLDLSSIDALAEAVNRFDGGVVVVSHDQHFVQRVSREVWTVEEGLVKLARWGFEEYRAKLLAKVAPNTELASEALEAYLKRKLVQSGGQISRLDLAREAKAFK
jgi:ATP-binding cassette subfamily F protein 3